MYILVGACKQHLGPQLLTLHKPILLKPPLLKPLLLKALSTQVAVCGNDLMLLSITGGALQSLISTSILAGQHLSRYGFIGGAASEGQVQ